ncbi:tryptophan-rich antigen [Plasmodium cynomolgi strain B]|uniref:Tryptophan-rich antigen n=1 Tax=Plasmodium cynomolgi (strain B) TaxID=1120755 RepID=K6VJH0_PLACD|nr:tryptophan-rich antigen [Plasmodium cynomolgi strain B]GAB69547.1 tryptophan-rich antigen [Plasmodium cynomolgi strain B]
MKIIFLLSYIPSFMSILSSASELVPALNKYFQKYKSKMKTRSYAGSTSSQSPEFMDGQEEWKEDQWNYFLKETEKDWEKFNTSMENLTSSWFEKKNWNGKDG